MLGILLIDKAAGITSHDAVQRIRRRFGTRRVGHSGTLDPLGRGLLVLAVGPATRFLQYLPMEPKVYEASVRFGLRTPTLDAESEPSETLPVPGDLPVRIEKALPRFLGLIEQVPPMFSAVKVDGQPLYRIARKGQTVERRARNIHISEIAVVALEPPVAHLRIVCSGGTYIRTLADDLGSAVGCGAHLAALRRTASGKFRLQDAVTLDGADPSHLIPLDDALGPMPAVQLDGAQTDSIRKGKRLPLAWKFEGRLAALKAPSGFVFGVARVEGNELQPECVLPSEVEHR